MTKLMAKFISFIFLVLIASCGGGGQSSSTSNNPGTPAPSGGQTTGTPAPSGNQTPGTTTNQSPTADFTMPASALSGATVSIDASVSSDINGSISTYSINFGDGTSTVTQATPYFSHCYSAVGTYSVVLTVTDNMGSAATATKDITVGIIASTPINISNSPEISQQPKITLESGGSTDVVWYEYGDTMFARSVNGGSSFSIGKYVFPEIGGYSISDAQIVSTPNEIHVVATKYDLIYGGAEIVYARSSDGGSTFPSPVVMSTNDNLNSYAPSVVTDGGNGVGIVWTTVLVDSYSPDEGSYFTRSTDGGNSFAAPIKLPVHLDATMAMTAQYSYFISMHQTSGPYQVIFSRCKNDSTVVSTPVVLSNPSNDASNPSVRTDSAGNVYVAWIEASKILMAVSSDNGYSFSTPTTIAEFTRNSIYYSFVTGSAGQVYVAWWTGDIPSANLTSYISYSTDFGATFSKSLRIPGIPSNASCPQMIVRASGMLGIVWSSPFFSSTIMGDIYYSNIQVSIP
jgi:PKD domain-containing protein